VSGPQTALVGYRHDDSMRFVAEKIGVVVKAGKCGHCGHAVYVNESGARAIRERDCALVCRYCRHLTNRVSEIVECL
jgi:hypothetical protein